MSQSNNPWVTAPVHPRKMMAMGRLPLPPRSLASSYGKKRGRVIKPLPIKVK